MNITIKRYRQKGDAIDGHLYIEGSRICNTAENTKTALKAGTYPVVITKCKQQARKMPIAILHEDLHPACAQCAVLECVNSNTQMPTVCHQIKAGNGVYHREDGSIIVGTYIAPGCLKHPKQAFDAIYDRIRKNAERGNDITLTIEEHYPKPTPRELTPYQMGTRILKQF